jgi:hypothetical protein
MFSDRWQDFMQVARRDSGTFLGTLFRDSSIFLTASYLSVNRRFDTPRGAALGNELTRMLVKVRDACGGQGVDGERPYSITVNEVPYDAWAIPGMANRVEMRLTSENREYWLQLERHPGTRVLQVDTLATMTDPRDPRWVEVDRLELPPAPDHSLFATTCWRDDSVPVGRLVALVHDSESEYFVDPLQAWTLDPITFHIRSTSADGVECTRSTRLRSNLPALPLRARRLALTFTPSAGASRVYVFFPGVTYLEDEVATVSIDSTVVGRVEPGSFLMVEVSPGRHVVGLPAGRHLHQLAVTVAPDSAAFVSLRWKRLIWSTRQALPTLADPRSARSIIRGQRLVPSASPPLSRAH